MLYRYPQVPKYEVIIQHGPLNPILYFIAYNVVSTYSKETNASL